MVRRPLPSMRQALTSDIIRMKKNKNRSQKFRGSHRRLTSRDTSMDSYSGHEDDDDDDADYHD
jgi:hypothetical protein